MILTYILLFACSLLGVYFFKQYAFRKGLLDNPNHRSLHTIPTPRGGGIVFIALWILFILLNAILGKIFWVNVCLFLLPTVLISAISYLDDRYSLSAKIRFLVQAIASVIAMILLGHLSLDVGFFSINNVWLIFPLIFLMLMWSTNLFNFMDGMDGFAAVEAIFVLGVGAYLLYLKGGMELSYILWALFALILGFLVWNRPKASIFMGDVGSASLGFIILFSGLVAQKYYQLPLILWLMLYGVFIFDATITLVRRLLNGEKWYEAHRKHAYQRLNQAGWSHGQVMAGLIMLNTFISGMVLLGYWLSALIPYLFLIELALLIIVYLHIEKQRPQNNLKG